MRDGYTDAGSMLDKDDISQIRALAELEGRCPDKAVREAIAYDRRCTSLNRIHEDTGVPYEEPYRPMTALEIRNLAIRATLERGLTSREVGEAFGLSPSQVRTIRMGPDLRQRSCRHSGNF